MKLYIPFIVALLFMASEVVFSQATIDPDFMIFGRDSLPQNSEFINDTFMIYEPYKGVLRGGKLDNSRRWAPDSLGRYSLSWGLNTMANGELGSVALGYETKALGHTGNVALGAYSVANSTWAAMALGYRCQAFNGVGAMALGEGTTASGGNGPFASGVGSIASGGWASTAMGYQSESSGVYGTTAIGNSAKATGDRGSTAIGRRTIASGDYGAIALGDGTHATGNSCTVVGSFNDTIVATGTTLLSTSPVFIVGNGYFDNPSNAMVILKNGRVGLGTNTPSHRLHLNSSEYGDITGIKITNSGTNSLIYHHSGGHLILRKQSEPNQVVLETSGKVGIGRIPTDNKLEVNGAASKTEAGEWLANSDSRLKKNIRPISEKEALDKLLGLKGVYFEWDDDQTGILRPEGLQTGFIAQDILKVFPEEVTLDKQGFYQTAYGTYDPIFVQAFKALYLETQELKKENQALKDRLTRIEQQLKIHDRSN